MIRVYLASSIENRSILQFVWEYLREKYPDIYITSEWVYNYKEVNNQVRARMDFEAIDNSDILIGFYPYGETGTLCELAYAYAKGKYVIYITNDSFRQYDPLIVGLFTEVYSYKENYPKYCIISVPDSPQLLLDILKFYNKEINNG